MTSHQFDALLLDLYACPADRSRWPVVLDQVCQATGARSAVVQLIVHHGCRQWSRWMVRDSESTAAADAHDLQMSDDVNPRVRTGRGPALLGSKPILRDGDFFAPDDPALAELKQRLAAIRLGLFMSASVSLPGGEALALVLHRDLDDRNDFEREDERFAMTLLPHLRQTVQLAENLEAARHHSGELEEAMNTVRAGLVLCGPDARPSWVNRAAEQLFARRDRIWLSGNRLTASSVQETATLRRMIIAAARGAPASDEYLVVGRSAGGEPLQVLVRPLPGPANQSACRHGDAHECGRVLLLISEPSAAPVLPPEVIARVFALSPTEARLAAALCRGLTVNEYAASHGVSIETARSQLKQVLAKTQAHRQSDLVRRMCLSVIAQTLQRAS
jgi:DNA-binding CsgD family transcriptional regulator